MYIWKNDIEVYSWILDGEFEDNEYGCGFREDDFLLGVDKKSEMGYVKFIGEIMVEFWGSLEEVEDRIYNEMIGFDDLRRVKWIVGFCGVDGKFGCGSECFKDSIICEFKELEWSDDSKERVKYWWEEWMYSDDLSLDDVVEKVVEIIKCRKVK